MVLGKANTDQELLTEILGANAEVRPQQITLIKTIRDVIENKYQVLIGEAPPGTGKSLSYLIPIVEHILEKRKNTEISPGARRNKECVIVSTYTKTLQRQLTEKDIPLINDYLRKNNIPEIRCLAFYGAENYVCLRRYFKLAKDVKDGAHSKEKDAGVSSEVINKVGQWLSFTKTGLFDEIGKECRGKAWAQMNRQTELCMGDECGYWGSCHYFKAKYKMHRDSDIAVVNHYLFMRNLQADKRLLPPYSLALIDEAHTAPDVARMNLSSELSNWQLMHVLNRLYNKGGGFLVKFAVNSVLPPAVKSCADRCEDTKEVVEQYFNKLKEIAFKESSFSLRVKKDTVIPETDLTTELKKIAMMLEDIIRDTSISEDTVFEGKGIIRNLDEYRKVLAGFIERGQDEFVYWIEVESNKNKKQKDMRVSIKYMYTEVGEKLKTMMFADPKVTTLLFSATIGVSRSGGFDYFKKEMGIEQSGTTIVKELVIPSPFDYKKQILVYMPKNGVAPDMPGYERYLADEIMALYRMNQKSGGGTFALFRSFKTMADVETTGKTVYGEEFNPMLQGNGLSNQEIIDTMKTEEGAFGFGQCSFWQGVDIPGKNLNILIITRLPFTLPDNPVYAARAEKIKEEKRSPFYELAIKLATLWFRQGVGRLIRTKDDMGIICILDLRVATKPYGKQFMWYLDQCEVTADRGRAEEFLNAIEWKKKGAE